MASNLLPSDDANPDFVGARDPDQTLFVRFYQKTRKNNFLTAKEGRPIFEDVDFVIIQVPGDKNFNLDVPVNETHKQRFPKHWAHYLNSKRTDSGGQIGTPLSEWTLLTRSQSEELKYLGFLTVDSIANASDAQLQSLGMKMGHQPHTFREKARAWLSQTSRSAAAEQDVAEKTELRNQLQESQRAIEELRAQMASMAEKGKPGRKPKQEVEA